MSMSGLTADTTNDSTALLVSGSPVGVSASLLRELAAHASFVLAVDSGADLLASADIAPSLLMGDLDSLGTETLAAYEAGGVPIQSCDPYKDATDLELALEALFGRGYRRVVTTNVLGGRTDHALGSLAALAAAAHRGMEIVIRDEHEICYLIPPTAKDTPLVLNITESCGRQGIPQKLTLEPLEPLGLPLVGDTLPLLSPLLCPSYLSLIAWGGEVTITLKEVEWPLENHVLTPQSALGISNLLRGQTLYLAVTKGPGTALLFLSYLS